MSEEDKPDRGPGDWDADPLESLARELRETVGSEFRAEAETIEIETEIGRLRRRNMRDVAREAANRGDRVSVVTTTRTVTGSMVYVGKDYLSIDTPTEHLDALLDRVSLVISPSPAGGVDPRGGSITFKARLSEYEQTGEKVELTSTRLGFSVSGRIEVVAQDHVTVLDADGRRNIFPLDTVDLVIRSRRSR